MCLFVFVHVCRSVDRQYISCRVEGSFNSKLSQGTQINNSAVQCSVCMCSVVACDYTFMSSIIAPVQISLSLSVLF